MIRKTNHFQYRQSDSVYPSVKIFYELMAKKVQEVLLVSNPYDAFIMEEDGRLAGRIIHEYRGLNLSRPPRLTWVSTGRDALSALSKSAYDLVITMPRLDDMDPFELCRKVKERVPRLPVFLLTHSTSPALMDFGPIDRTPFDKMYVWQGNTDLLLAIIKSVEDRMNVAADTRIGRVQVIILVEDEPLLTSSIIPLLYREIVMQTQRAIDESINEEHRLLRMRARPKLLTAETFEEALRLYHEYAPYVLSVISDTRFPKNGIMEDLAGISLLQMIKRERPDIALLNLSSDESNREAAQAVPATFLNKQSPAFLKGIRAFFREYLGFGDFIFRRPDGREIDRAHNLRSMEKILPQIPEDALLYHASKNHFSTWLMARAEIELADRIRPFGVSDFSNAREIKAYIIECLAENRRERQKGAVIDFLPDAFDPESDFVKIGDGSLGGKARGLAFFSTLLQDAASLKKSFPRVNICIPKTLVITTDGFDRFMDQADLKNISAELLSDTVIKKTFLSASFPEELRRNLSAYLSYIHYPIAVRSSSLLEDSQSQPFAGIYQTYMIPNVHPDPEVRLKDLVQAVKLVFASVYLEAARSFSESTFHQAGEDKMAVIIQQVVGTRYNGVFYPAVSGVAHSYNFYPVSHMKPEEGVACIALGLGKTIVDGVGGLRFSPKYPELLPGFSTVDDILKNAQRRFFALRLTEPSGEIGASDTGALVQLTVEEARAHFPVSFLSGTYVPEEHRIRTIDVRTGPPVLTFANILKHKTFPLDQILLKLLEIGRIGMGGAVEMEFAVDLYADSVKPPTFAVLQIRPMTSTSFRNNVAIRQEDIQEAVCKSGMALGNGIFEDIEDIVYVKPDVFDPAKTAEIAADIGKLNHKISQTGGKYILIGSGRWGSADPWLGIPVKWKDISGVGIIVETASEKMRATPSQGTHFFHNITALGISYITIRSGSDDMLNWEWLYSLPVVFETAYVRHVKAVPRPVIKINGKTSTAVIIKQ